MIQLSIERVARHRLRVAENDEFHPGSGDGHVHAAQVAQKAYLAFVVGPDEGDEDDVALLTLKSVDGVDGDKMPIGLEEGFLCDESPEVLHLCAVGGNHADIDAFVEDTLFPDFCKIVL